MTDPFLMGSSENYLGPIVLYPKKDNKHIGTQYDEVFNDIFGSDTDADNGTVELCMSDVKEYEEGLVGDMRRYPRSTLRRASFAAKDVAGDDCVVRLTSLDKVEERRTVEGLGHRDIGELVFIDAIVDSRTAARPRTILTHAECEECGCTYTIRQRFAVDDIETLDSCEIDSCDGSVSNVTDVEEAKFESKEPLMADSQRLSIVDVPENRSSDNEDAIVADLVGEDLVNEVVPGERVTIAGIVRVDKTNEMDKHLWLQVVGIEAENGDYASVDITKEDIDRIEDLAEEPDVVERLRGSLAPSIADRETVKEAVLMSLFGGIHKTLSGDDFFRDDLNVLVVGDPSTGKSTIVRHAASVAPKSRYTSGKSASGVGVTASVEKVEHLRHKEWAVKRGAVSAASGGIAVLDELDKMSDRTALNEPMSEQQVSVEKASVSSTLPADTTILAAANPPEGRFDPVDSLGEQIQLDDSLLSRFDLVFALRDDQSNDEAIASHVLSAASGEVKTTDGSGGDILDEETMSKYIAYARRTYEPEMTQSAKDIIEDYWLDMRSKTDDNRVPIDSRRLEAMCRLSEASAKARLSDTVTENDAERAVRLMSESLNQTATDSEGKLDIDLHESGQSQSQRKRRERITETVEQLAVAGDDYGCSREAVVGTLSDDFSVNLIERDIQTMLSEGDLWRTDSGGLAT